MTLDNGLCSLVRRYFDDSLAQSSGLLSDTQTSVFEKENNYIATASKQRKIDFLNGRHHARCALQKVGYTAGAILRTEDGQPIWPAEYVGSITHSRQHCMAIAARRSDFAAVGVDMEEVSDKVSRVRKKFLQFTEYDAAPDPNPYYDTRIFSAKEAFFKAYYPLTRYFLGFRDAIVELDDTNRKFKIQIVNPNAPPLFCCKVFEGLSLAWEGEVISVIWIKPNRYSH